ncbi:hypothetical protein MTR67_008555 [Solanum verrucosum]|uniref:Uncharacterized protein n=1 Tax=Solanum verrucosum TaxID=315347 RepID=A0AAF0Q429_SOLVR|nr:hypothetical protein MTR67_008555 [Solanum verrucosum]
MSAMMRVRLGTSNGS